MAWTRLGGAAVINRKDQILESERSSLYNLLNLWMVVWEKSRENEDKCQEWAWRARAHQWRWEAWKMWAGKSRWCIQIVEWCVALYFWSELKGKERSTFGNHLNQDDSWIRASEITGESANSQDGARHSLKMSSVSNPPPTSFLRTDILTTPIRKLDAL